LGVAALVPSKDDMRVFEGAGAVNGRVGDPSGVTASRSVGAWDLARSVKSEVSAAVVVERLERPEAEMERLARLAKAEEGRGAGMSMSTSATSAVAAGAGVDLPNFKTEATIF
jgi:hypothetical protein